MTARKPVVVAILGAAAIGILVLLVMALLSSHTSTVEVKIPVKAEEFGDQWPLTVSSGYIIKYERYIPNVSFKSYSVIFEAPDGIRYGLNGHAQSQGYRNIHAITKSRLVFGDPIYEDVSELVNVGLNSKD